MQARTMNMMNVKCVQLQLFLLLTLKIELLFFLFSQRRQFQAGNLIYMRYVIRISMAYNQRSYLITFFMYLIR